MDLIEFTKWIEPVFWLSGGLVLCWIYLNRSHTDDNALNIKISKTTELFLLASTLTLAAALRLVLWDYPIPASIFAGEVTALQADARTHESNLFNEWLMDIQKPNPGGTLYQSPLLQPVIVAFNSVFGVGLHSIVKVGAFWGILTVLLAWLCGRILHGQVFGYTPRPVWWIPSSDKDSRLAKSLATPAEYCPC